MLFVADGVAFLVELGALAAYAAWGHVRGGVAGAVAVGRGWGIALGATVLGDYLLLAALRRPVAG